VETLPPNPTTRKDLNMTQKHIEMAKQTIAKLGPDPDAFVFAENGNIESLTRFTVGQFQRLLDEREEMLEALKFYAAITKSGVTEGHVLIPAKITHDGGDIARAAIAKATGEA